MDTFFTFLGVERVAGLIAMFVAITVVTVYLYYRLRHWGGTKISEQFAPLRTPSCPGCSSSLESVLESNEKSMYAGYQQRAVTCECLIVSQWDIMGHPVCLGWRPPTLEEIKHANDLVVYREQAAKIEETRRVARAIRKAKFKR